MLFICFAGNRRRRKVGTTCEGNRRCSESDRSPLYTGPDLRPPAQLPALRGHGRGPIPTGITGDNFERAETPSERTQGHLPIFERPYFEPRPPPRQTAGGEGGDDSLDR